MDKRRDTGGDRLLLHFCGRPLWMIPFQCVSIDAETDDCKRNKYTL